MKRFIILVLLVFIVVFPTFVCAEYKESACQEVNTMLQEFYRVEQENRLTLFSMRALISEINAIFEKNVVLPVETKDEKE